MPHNQCRHCGGRIRAKRRKVFCSEQCQYEHRWDGQVNSQRLNTFEYLAEKGSWLPLSNSTVYGFSNPYRKVKVLENQLQGNKAYYRLTRAGYKLLERWKAKMGVVA